VLHGVLKLVTSTIKATNFFFRRRVQTGSGVRTVSYPMGTGGGGGGLIPEEKWPGREADHSFSSSVEVQNAWSYTSTSPIRLHGVVLN
jgi:hypothetical protein